MKDIDTASLRALALAATPGPWRNGADQSHFDSPEVTDDKTFSYYVPTDRDAAYIASVSPDVVLAMLDEIERLRGILSAQESRVGPPVARMLNAVPELLDELEIERGAFRIAQADIRAALAAKDAEIERLRLRASELEASMDAAQAVLTSECVEHVELNGHIDIAKECCDYLDHEAMDSGDPSGKLRDFVTSLSIVVQQFDKQRRRANWHEAGYKAGKQKLIEHALAKNTAAYELAIADFVEQLDAMTKARDALADIADAHTFAPTGVQTAAAPLSFGHTLTLPTNYHAAACAPPAPQQPHGPYEIAATAAPILGGTITTVDTGKPHRDKARIAELRKVGGAK